VDAVYQAINRIVGVSNTLTEFSIKAVTEGIDAVGEVTIRIQPHNGDPDSPFNPQTGASFVRTFSGHGASTDIIVASGRAYVSALNKMLAAREEKASTLERKAVAD
jgi:2-isopropylmalate synthase